MVETTNETEVLKDKKKYSSSDNRKVQKRYKKDSVSKKRSRSLDNICDDHLSSPSKSILGSSPKLKVLKKKFHLLKLSKSNTDIAAAQADHAQQDFQPRLHGSNPGSMHLEGHIDPSKGSGMIKVPSKDEMRKKSRFENQGSLYDQFSLGRNSNSDKFDLGASLSSRGNRLRSSEDSLEDQYYDSTYEDASSTYEMYDETDGTAIAEHTMLEAERLQKKIDKIREELRRMQSMKDDSVQDYLKTVEHSEDTIANEKIKVNFEKQNQKTNQTIQLLQKKLEKHQLQLKELDERGIHGTRRIMRVVQDSVRSGASTLTGAVSKPLGSINQFMKKDKKNLSSDNISITVTKQAEDDIERSYLTSAARSYSDDDINSSSSSNHMIAATTNGGSTDERLCVSHDSYDVAGPDYNVVQTDRINELTKQNETLLNTVDDLKETMQQMLRSLQEERFKTEQLQVQLDDLLNQWNDMTELHQNEMMDLKQEMDRAGERIECVEYRFTERTDEIEESVDQRITRMELQQQQQQQILLSVDNYFDASGNAKMLLSKFLSLVISLFAIVLVVITTAARIVMPFATTRMRVITSIATLTALILILRNSEHELIQGILFYIKKLFAPIYTTIAVQAKEKR